MKWTSHTGTRWSAPGERDLSPPFIAGVVTWSRLALSAILCAVALYACLYEGMRAMGEQPERMEAVSDE